MKRVLITAAVALGTVAWAAEEHGGHDPQGQRTQGVGGAGTGGGAAEQQAGGRMAELGVTVPDDLNLFVSRLAHGNELELTMARLAQQRATSDAVKAHAQRMLRDHGAVKARLTALARQEKLSLSTPQPLDDREKRMMDARQATLAKLEVMEGRAFDTAYLTAMLDSHDEAISKVVVAAEQFRDTALARLLERELPALMAHRAATYELLGKERPTRAALRSGK